MSSEPTPPGQPHLSVIKSSPESRLATLIVGAAIGAVLAVLVGAVFFPATIQPLAYAAVAVIGSVAGSGLGVLALAVRRSRSASDLGFPTGAVGVKRTKGAHLDPVRCVE